jgi:hypothetical protein
MTRSIVGSAASVLASRVPRYRLTPVTRTTRGFTGLLPVWVWMPEEY